MAAAGKYIIIEGADGTGKSTQAELLVQFLNSRNIKAVLTQEPGGVPIAEELRTIIKNGTLARDPWTNVMLFTTSRRTSWLQSIQPHIKQGTWVVASRSYLSTVAYQGYGEGVDIQKIIDFTTENVGTGYMSPDKVIILTLGDESTRKSRLGGRSAHDQKHDTFESMPDDFQTKMQKGYEDYAAIHDLDVINASQPIEAVQDEVQSIIQKLI
jgi:dTMP kinase